MTDHATRARELYHKILAEDPSQSVESIAAALDLAAQEAVKVFQDTIGDYVTMRSDMAEQGIATEVLSGNTVKEARELAALAELQGLQDAILNYWKLSLQAAQEASGELGELRLRLNCPIVAPSCLVCGQQRELVIKHLEAAAIGVCEVCRTAAQAAQPVWSKEQTACYCCAEHGCESGCRCSVLPRRHGEAPIFPLPREA